MTVDEFIEYFYANLTPEGKKYLLPVMFASVICGTGISSCLVSEPEPAPVVKLPQRAEISAGSADSTPAAVPIAKPVVLHSPFSAEHNEREQVHKSLKTASVKGPAEKTERTRSRKEPVKLVGTASSSAGVMAVFSRGNEHWSMAPGERHGDVELLELTEAAAVVETSEGILTLRLSGR